MSFSGVANRYLNDPVFHAKVIVICNAMNWIVPRSGGQPHIKGVEDAAAIIDALDALERSLESNNGRIRVASEADRP